MNKYYNINKQTIKNFLTIILFIIFYITIFLILMFFTRNILILMICGFIVGYNYKKLIKLSKNIINKYIIE